MADYANQLLHSVAKAQREVLVRSCQSCAHFDGDCHCTLPEKDQRFTGAIRVPALVVCDQHDVTGAKG